MEIVYFMLAEFAGFTPDERLNIIGGDFDSIPLGELPGSIPHMSAVAKILMDQEWAARPHEFSIDIRDPNGVKIHDHRLGCVEPDTLPVARKSMNLRVLSDIYGVFLPTEGKYSVNLNIDGQVATSLYFNVMRSPSLGGLKAQ